MSDKREYFDVDAEPNLHAGAFQGDPSEYTVPPIDGSEDEISTIRDSVTNEPAFTGKLEQSHLGHWLQDKREQCTLKGNLLVTLAAALVAGPFAVIGALMSGGQGTTQFVYMILFAPVIEELLKQSGMIYLLEKKPYRIFSIWQFVLAAIISAFIFAAIENLLYIHFHASDLESQNIAALARFRWMVCVPVHVSCSIIASMGLMRVWKKQLSDGRAADLSQGFVAFAIAMFAHGSYNLASALLNPQF